MRASSETLRDRGWAAALGSFTVPPSPRSSDMPVASSTPGDGLVATFDGPAHAARCGCAIRDSGRASDLEVRCGVHTAEIELRGADIAGIGVHIGARISGRAGPGEVWVSRTVKDPVAGSGLRFAERGDHRLKVCNWQILLKNSDREFARNI